MAVRQFAQIIDLSKITLTFMTVKSVVVKHVTLLENIFQLQHLGCCGCELNNAVSPIMKNPIKRNRPISLRFLALAEVTVNLKAIDIDNLELPTSIKEEMYGFKTHLNTKSSDFILQCDL